MADVLKNFVKNINVDGSVYTIPYTKSLLVGDYYRIYVDSSQATNGDGSSSNPFNNIDDAIDYANNGYSEFRIYLRPGTYNLKNVRSVSNTNIHIVPNGGNVTINFNHPSDGIFNFYNSHVNIGSTDYQTTLNFDTSGTTYFEGGSTTFRKCLVHSNNNFSFISQGFVTLEECTFYTRITARGSNIYVLSTHFNLSGDLITNTSATECIYGICSMIYLDTKTDGARPIFNVINNNNIRRIFNLYSSKLVMGDGGVTNNYSGSGLTHSAILSYSEILGSSFHINLLINANNILLNDSLLNGTFYHEETITNVS